ncbi:hypothetical protein F511_26207 [Dorcoceras hygrometricum]|uniref:Uncharacterized protein n=1 Tax=Dorcoceras hygrometricum TaxID=472368 RepID=A0A2Z7AXR7_9LAMI|nr:hypothetical protein F511_26207 [Dorcoceras hygrometricum]
MAASLISNALQVNFDSVLSFPDEGMVAMFKALESTGLRGFLGCPSVLYEKDLESFFSNATVHGDSVKSCVQSKYIAISAELFAGAFGLPTEGLKDMNEGAPDLTLGEAKTFLPQKILTVKTVGKYVARNKNITAEEETDEPPVEKMVKKVVAKRRPAPAVAEPAAKKKRTTMWRAAPTEKILALVPVATEAEPISVGTDPWRSGCRLSLFRKRKQLPHRPVADAFVPMCLFIEPVQDLDSRPPYSGIVRRHWTEVCVDILQFYLFSHLQPVGTYNLCRDIVAIGSVVDLETEPTGFFGVFRRGLDANQNPYSPSSSSVSPILFTADDIPQTPPTDDIPLDEAIIADIPHILLPSIEFTESDNVADLKDALSSKITGLELGFEEAFNRQNLVYRGIFNEVRRDIQNQKADLTQNLDDIRKEVQDQKVALAHYLLEFRVETQENFHILSAQWSQIITYINRGRDDKKGEDSSSRGPQPPEDRSRPGDGGRGRGSSSEPSKKRGGGLYRGGVTCSRGLSHWIGDSDPFRFGLGIFRSDQSVLEQFRGRHDDFRSERIGSV